METIVEDLKAPLNLHVTVAVLLLQYKAIVYVAKFMRQNYYKHTAHLPN